MWIINNNNKNNHNNDNGNNHDIDNNISNELLVLDNQLDDMADGRVVDMGNPLLQEGLSVFHFWQFYVQQIS